MLWSPEDCSPTECNIWEMKSFVKVRSFKLNEGIPKSAKKKIVRKPDERNYGRVKMWCWSFVIVHRIWLNLYIIKRYPTFAQNSILKIFGVSNTVLFIKFIIHWKLYFLCSIYRPFTSSCIFTLLFLSIFFLQILYYFLFNLVEMKHLHLS